MVIDLVGKLCLDLGIRHGASGAPRAYGRINGELAAEGSMSDRLIAGDATRVGYSRRSVFSEQIKISTARDVGIELIDGSVGGNCCAYAWPPKDYDNLDIEISGPPK